MPLLIKWSAFNKNNVLAESNSYGIYEIGDNDGKIRYIGEGRLKDRLNSHFVGGEEPIPRSAKYRKEVTGSKVETTVKLLFRHKTMDFAVYRQVYRISDMPC